MTTQEQIKQLETEEAELWKLLGGIEEGLKPLREKWLEKYRALANLRNQESESKNDNA